jgi:Nucleotidyltransferase of unknown function (DUF6036)
LDDQHPGLGPSTSRLAMLNIPDLVSSGTMEISGETLDVILGALAEQLRALADQQEIVVIGGSALTALGFVKRATKDVDLVAIAVNGDLRPAKPLPESLRVARDRVARDFDLGENWLNDGPADLLRWGLPDGFMTRIVTRCYGQALMFISPDGSTRSTLSSLRWWITLEGVMRRICERFVQPRRN